jgi:hypothetical protein
MKGKRKDLNRVKQKNSMPAREPALGEDVTELLRVYYKLKELQLCYGGEIEEALETALEGVDDALYCLVMGEEHDKGTKEEGV